MDKKICQKCGKEKELNDMAKYKDREGNYSYRNVCRGCYNIQTSKNKDYNKVEVKQIKPKIIEPVKDVFNIFNDEEIKVLKNLIEDYPKLNKMLQNKIKLGELNRIDDMKIKKSVSISITIHNKITELSDKSNLNYSQIIENLLKKALE